jgi:hypothetical protein
VKSSVSGFLALLLVCFTSHLCAYENVHLSGFGSIVGGQAFDGSAYVADYPNLGIYDDDFDMGQETRFGLQLRVELNDKASITAQAMARASEDYDADVEWFYLTYNIYDDLSVQAGKMRLPVYYYSQYMDVGIAYPWIRVPADAYSLDITNFNGVQLNHTGYSGSISYKASFYTGREDIDDSELMGYLFDNDPDDITGVGEARVDREFTNILGVGFEVGDDTTTAKLSFTQSDFEETITNSFTAEADGDIEFYDIYVKQSFGPVDLMAEYNKYQPFYESYFASATYTRGKNVFYILYSKFDLELPFEEHDTVAIGVRHNLSSKMALKFDLSTLNDDGESFGQPNPVNKDPDGDGDVSIFSASFDFIF